MAELDIAGVDWGAVECCVPDARVIDTIIADLHHNMGNVFVLVTEAEERVGVGQALVRVAV